MRLRSRLVVTRIFCVPRTRQQYGSVLRVNVPRVNVVGFICRVRVVFHTLGDILGLLGGLEFTITSIQTATRHDSTISITAP